MNEYLMIAFKTLFFLLIILLIIRIMGKRELGQLNVFDIIVSFMISEIFSNAIADPNTNILLALLPIFIIFVVQIFISMIVLKSKKIRYFIDSKPSLIINGGVIDYQEMKKQRYNISDLLQQVRQSGVDDLNDVSYAILESNGALSVIKNSDSKLLSPFALINDGKIDEDVKKKLQIDDLYINTQLVNLNLSVEDVFIGFIDKNKKLIVFSKKYNNVN